MTKRKKRFGDRSEGRRLRTLDPIAVVANYVMVNRNGSSNLIYDEIDITDIEDYIMKKRDAGMQGFGLMHVFVAAYIRMIAKYPGINRFLSGQRVYARNNIQIVIAVKKTMELLAQETTIKMDFEPDATVDDVYRRFTDEFEKNKVEGDATDFDGVARAISHIPGVFCKFFVWLMKAFDYFGFLPKKILEVSPFHGSMFITSMGSLGIPPIFHHLYDFGNIPVFLALGAKKKVRELDENGKVIEKKHVEFSFTTDERICDGFYFASALKYMKVILKDPTVLDNPPDEVVEDID